MNLLTSFVRSFAKPLFLFASSLLPAAIIAQSNIAIAPVKLNVLYIGVNNPVAVAASNGSDDKVTVTIEGGGAKLTKAEAGLYNVQVASVTDDCQLKVYVDGKLSGSSTFRVRTLPVPQSTVGGFASGSKIDAAVFKKQAGVGAYLKDFPFAVRYDVLGYTISLADEKGVRKTVTCEGAGFSAEAKNELDALLKTGTVVNITHIRAKDEGGRQLTLPSLVYYIQ